MLKAGISYTLLLSALLASNLLTAQGSDDAGNLYAIRCAACHEAPDPDAAHPPPHRTELAEMPTENLYRALTQGVMRMQASGLSNAQLQGIAEYVTGRPLQNAALDITTNLCADNPPIHKPYDTPAWNGWGRDHHNQRAAIDSGITAEDLPSLKLKWVYGLPGEDQPRSQPALFQGRLFVGSKAGALYSLDADTGCTYWTYRSRTGIRSAISLGPIRSEDNSEDLAVWFVDLRANVHAVNAHTGEELWVTNVESHPGVRGTGALTYYDGHLYVPASGVVEETSSSGPDYACCTFRGSITKLDAGTGEVLWKTYTMPEPEIRGVSEEGVPLYGPSGAGIWSAPTIDENRGLLYAATGNAYGDPAPETSDAVLALSLEDGALIWVNQLTPGDAFIGGCDNVISANCPDELGPDYDFSASPILTSTSAGRELLVIPQKSGMAYALDPQNEGQLVWQYRLGAGSRSGGFWGMSVAEGIAYAPTGGYSNQDSGGIHAIDLATGERRWYTPPQDLLCNPGFGCRATQSAAVTAIPGAVFSGAADGGMRAYSADTGEVLWVFNSNAEFETINGVPAAGGSFDGPGPVVADGMVYFLSGNCCIVGRPGNALFAFDIRRGD